MGASLFIKANGRRRLPQRENTLFAVAKCTGRNDIKQSLRLAVRQATSLCTKEAF